METLAFWTMVNSLAVTGMASLAGIGFLWVISELEHIKNKQDNLK